MKKIVLATMLASGLMADSGLYIGLDYGKASNTHTFSLASYAAHADNDYSNLKLKIGGGTDGEWKFQGTLDKIDYKIGVFDTENNSLYEIGFDIIKEFEVTKELYPFIKIGFGAGQMSTTFTTEGRMNEVYFSGGAGLSYKATSNVYILAGADYIARRWNDVAIGAYTLETNDKAIKPYIGVNYKF